MIRWIGIRCHYAVAGGAYAMLLPSDPWGLAVRDFWLYHARASAILSCRKPWLRPRGIGGLSAGAVLCYHLNGVQPVRTQDPVKIGQTAIKGKSALRPMGPD